MNTNPMTGPADQPLRPLKVLFAEDDDDHAEILNYGLKRSAYCLSASRVSDGLELLRYLEDHQPGTGDYPDLVLLDLKMPRMDGLEALAALKSNPAFLDLPILILSTSDSAQDRERAFQSHANAYMLKPSGLSVYREMIEDVLKFWGRWSRGTGTA